MYQTWIETIPHNDQKYDTVGDYSYHYDSKPTEIHISQIGNPIFEFLVALHEFIESFLCRQKGIPCEKITEFDLLFEKEREAGFHTDEEEPGDDPRAPYHREHRLATAVEFFMAMLLGVNWKEYEQAIYSLQWRDHD